MIEISLAFVVSAFVAGVLMFLAPCTLPLVPAYLAFISGVKQEELDTPKLAEAAKRKIILNGAFFVLGFTLVFILFGVLAGAVGSQIGLFRGLLSQIGGAFIILFGLMMLNVIKFFPLQKEYKISLPKIIKPGHVGSSFLIGNIFALGWTPCVGPVLASVILLATDSATVASGGVMLAVFSLGLAVPFMITATLYSRAEQKIAKYSKLSKSINLIGGVFLVIIGLLLLTENFELTVIYGYEIFQFLNLEFFYDYL